MFLQKNEGIEKCAKLVATILKKSGINSEILRIKKGVAPVVFAEVKSKKNPHKTILFYNHYDVQPVEPFELWDDDPFSGKIKGNKIVLLGLVFDFKQQCCGNSSCRRIHKTVWSSTAKFSKR